MAERRFLLWLLTGIFVVQAGVFGYGIFYCSQDDNMVYCPRIGERYEATFNMMVATTLALLTGNSVHK